MGDVIAELAVRNAWSGVVINGAGRDVAALHRLDVGIVVFAEDRMAF